LEPEQHGDEVLTAGLSRSDLSTLYEYMVLGRAAEERLEVLFKQGHVKGGLYRSLGQEAVGVGTAFALDRRSDGRGDIIGQTIRTTGAVFLMGGTPLQYFRQYLARATGPTRGKEANVHWCDFRKGLLGPVSPLGTMIEVMAGITLAFRQTGEPRVGLVYGGDGASSTGAWHEGINFAAVRRCPMVVVVQSNRWAFSTPTAKQTRLESFTRKAAGYGVAAESVDGNDVIAVFETAQRAVDRARAGDGVTLIEARTYRRRGHAQHDAQEYVPPGEIEEWEAKDPVERFRQRSQAEGWLTVDALDQIDKSALERCEADALQAVSEPSPDPRQALEGVYASLVTPDLWTRTGGSSVRNGAQTGPVELEH